MIHYHGTPLSGAERVQTALAARHAMVSFATGQSVLPLVAEVCQSFTLDNGAYSVWKQGGELDLEGYAEWVTLWSRHPGCDWWLIPDVIDGTEEQNSQLRGKFSGMIDPTTRSMGVPIWHLHEHLDELNYLCAAYPRVALGSSAQYAQIGTPQWWSRMAEAMEVICEDGRPRVKLHGLRMLSPTIFSHFPFSSCDSTNVARNIGHDSAWTGAYAPESRYTRALVIMERIERHASAATWTGTGGIQANLELFG